MNKLLIAGALGLATLAAPLTASAGVHVGVGLNLGYPGYYGGGYYGPRYYGPHYYRPAYYGYYGPYYAPPPVVYTAPPVVVEQPTTVIREPAPISECTRYQDGTEVCH